MKLTKIISGGQIGVDLAALKAAKDLSLETGGWMPKGFLTKTGFKPEYADLYCMQETFSHGYPQRTHMNVGESDATVRIAYNFESYGELCTLKAIKKADKPYMDIRIHDYTRPFIDSLDDDILRRWVMEHEVETLNIAGNANHRFEKIAYNLIMLAFDR